MKLKKERLPKNMKRLKSLVNQLVYDIGSAYELFCDEGQDADLFCQRLHHIRLCIIAGVLNTKKPRKQCKRFIRALHRQMYRLVCQFGIENDGGGSGYKDVTPQDWTHRPTKNPRWASSPERSAFPSLYAIEDCFEGVYLNFYGNIYCSVRMLDLHLFMVAK